MRNTQLAQINDDSRQLDHMTSSRLSDSLFSKDLAPHYMKLAGQLAASEIVPKCYRNKPSDLFLCWAKGYQLGIPPEQAMDCISVINGKAVMWGDEMLALCMSHPDFVDITEEPTISPGGTVTGYVCTIKRKGKSDTISSFTLDMAKKAGLLAKGGVWNQYPERMLKLRARGFALRDAFPDALKGIKSREEVEDYIEGEVAPSKLSRTEILKQELTNVEKLDNIYEVVIGDQDNSSGNEDSRSGQASEMHQGLSEMAESREEADKLHAKIKQLIEETGFTQDRLHKALKYYQVDSIEGMDIESAKHFIEKLIK
jgi:hypothetical protein